MEYVPFDKNVKVLGGVLQALIDGLGAFQQKALDLLKKETIESIDPEKWYSQEIYLNILKEIGSESILKQVGAKIPENAKFPPEIDDIIKALSALDMAYHMNHKDGEIGSYSFSPSGEKEGTMVCHNPYPCSFDEGLILGMARKFAPPKSFVRVTHDEGDCRKNGAEKCTYKISW